MSTKGLFDFHLHTSYSDGSLSPEKLLRYLCQCGVVEAAITDHDTLDGFWAAEALAWCSDWGPRPRLRIGMEISTRWGGKEIHVLAYDFQAPTSLDPFLQVLHQHRRDRIQRALALFHRTGFDLSLDDLPPTSAPGRWHLAQALAAKGYAKSPESAFRKWLQRGRRYYTKLQTAPVEEVAEWVTEHQGLMVLAHPHVYFAHPDHLERQLRSAGNYFAGLELYHSTFPESSLLEWVDLARRWDLKITGGSDFHHVQQGRFPGKGLGRRPLFTENLNGIFLDHLS